MKRYFQVIVRTATVNDEGSGRLLNGESLYFISCSATDELPEWAQYEVSMVGYYFSFRVKNYIIDRTFRHAPVEEEDLKIIEKYYLKSRLDKYIKLL